MHVTFTEIWSIFVALGMLIYNDTSHILHGEMLTFRCNIAVTHTHPFNGPFSGTTRVSRCQKGKTNLDFTDARNSEWQWHQLGHTQVCTSLQADNHASIPPLKFFTSRMPFLPPNQQRQSTESNKYCCYLLSSVVWRCWLAGRKSIRPVKNWVVICGYLSGARCRLAYGPTDATATHCLLLQ